MKINVFTDKNLYKTILNGWSEEKMLKGQIKTLTGRTFVVDVSEDDKVRRIKEKIEGIWRYKSILTIYD